MSTRTITKKEISAYEYSQLAKNEPDYEKRKAIYLEALEHYPNTAWLLSEFIYFLKMIKQDYNELEAYYKRLLKINPNHRNNYGHYANYLSLIKKDYREAEKYHLKAMQIDEQSANKNGNFAQHLLILGRKEEANEFLKEAFKLNNGEKRTLLLELWFYRYAHYNNEFPEAEIKIERLLNEGIKSAGWILEDNVYKAIIDGHPEPEKLKALAKKITAKA